MITFTPCFCVSRPVLSTLHELAPFIHIESLGRQHDYAHVTDEDTEAQRGDITRSAACKPQSWDWNLGRLPPEPIITPDQ